tara:strand:- start:209 stop:460 length:252 start_codon:yes stop_codon:yes gene_type:complete
MKKKVSEKDILIIIGKILKVNHNSLLKIDNYSKIKSWDSLAQLDIISALDKKLGGQIGKVKNIAEIKSIKKLISILRKKSLIV